MLLWLPTHPLPVPDAPWYMCTMCSQGEHLNKSADDVPMENSCGTLMSAACYAEAHNYVHSATLPYVFFDTTLQQKTLPHKGKQKYLSFQFTVTEKEG